MNTRQRRTPTSTRRPAVTLTEILLVLAILVLIGATAWPSLERSLADQRLRNAADMVRAQWQHARAEAMSSGIAYRFHYLPEDRTHWIEPCEDVDTPSNGSASSEGNAQALAASDADRSRLPEQITFVEGRVEDTSAVPSDPAAMTQDSAARAIEDGELNGPVVFSPDGTCSSAELTLRNEYDRSITVTLDGLTAIPRVGEVFDAEEGGP